ncbi:MAG: hypothetical protein QNJ19_08725 [Woeseiaceae bacterium]|nr:hypothetical protein [Woeseiaceae bacterium]
MKRLLTILVASSFIVGCAATDNAPQPEPNLAMYFQPLSSDDKQAITTAKHINAMQHAKPCTDPVDSGYARSRCH